MPKIDGQLGKQICDTYLDNLPELKEHSHKVAQLCKEIADKILKKNPELSTDINKDTLEFLGYVHNIGTSIKRQKHELHTIYLLKEKENIPEDIAIKTRHGQLVEDYEDDGENYYPIGLEGIILTYADISVRNGDVLPIKERVVEMEGQMEARDGVFNEFTMEMIERFKKAVPRYLRYETILNSLM